MVIVFVDMLMISSMSGRERKLIVPIGVRNAEFCEDNALSFFHALGFHLAAMVEACEMKDPMHDKVRGMLSYALLLDLRLRSRRFRKRGPRRPRKPARLCGRGWLAARMERKHVRRGVLAAKSLVQGADFSVAQKRDADASAFSGKLRGAHGLGDKARILALASRPRTSIGRLPP